jgi:GT2 family glycosyltransferase
VRKGTPDIFRQRSAELVRLLTFPQTQWIVYDNEQPGYREKYGANAAARNELIARHLQPWHTHVLWLDVDIIEIPPDLVERLLAVSDENGGAIVAPMVWMEKVGDGAVSLQHGGWFYDTGGFVKNGERASFLDGVPGEEAVAEMDSVGCVYLAPAQLYRDGAKYRPRGDEVEHLSFCRQAREWGVKVLAVRDLNVTHAYLPNYGERWHH